MTWIFTFGFGQIDPKTGLSLANLFVEVELDPEAGLAEGVETARHRMIDRFGGGAQGGNWAFDYPNREAAGVDRFRLHEIDFDTGQVLA
ncbi:MAG: hypothetical protein ACRD0W_24850 [Acidimicrobiales bacterium]